MVKKEDHVFKLEKSLYGLKKSPRKWYREFDAFMISHNFAHSSCDSCVHEDYGCRAFDLPSVVCG